VIDAEVIPQPSPSWPVSPSARRNPSRLDKRRAWSIRIERYPPRRTLRLQAFGRHNILTLLDDFSSFFRGP
jgi:hypothetical protein